jgi:hypothetical protein
MVWDWKYPDTKPKGLLEWMYALQLQSQFLWLHCSALQFQQV